MNLYNKVCHFYNKDERLNNEQLEKYIDIIQLITSYVANEQLIIKKDNAYGQNNETRIKYTFQEDTFESIIAFFKSIKFLSIPKIGTKKQVSIVSDSFNIEDGIKYKGKIIQDSFENYSLKDVIYIMDKIKDSFMHINNQEQLLYKVISNNGKGIIRIENMGGEDAFSLNCEIPIEALKQFVESTQKYNIDAHVHENIAMHKKIDVKKYESSDFKNLMLNAQTNDMLHSKGLIPYSYLTMLQASRYNYPLLPSLYQCECNFNGEQITKLVKNILDSLILYKERLNNLLVYNYQLTEKVLDSLKAPIYNVIYNMMLYNNEVIRHIRNSISHSNYDFDEDFVRFTDKKNNSSKNIFGTKDVPEFELTGAVNDVYSLFDEINDTKIKTRKNPDDLNDDIDSLKAISDGVLKHNTHSIQFQIRNAFYEQLKGFLQNCSFSENEEIRKKQKI